MRPRRVAIVVGVLVALQVIVAFLIRPVPDSIVELLGGPAGGVDRIGGLRVRYRPPAGLDPDEVERALADRPAVRREGELFVLEFPGVAEAMARDLGEILRDGGLAMREVLESDYAARIAETGPLPPDVTLETDRWQAEDDATVHEVAFLRAPTRALLERAIADARTRGWAPAPGSELAFERIEPWHDSRDRRPMWQTYELAREVAVDGSMIDAASGTYDPNTNRPIVLLEFTSDGAERFCEVTGRVTGRKLATILGDRIRSAPIINSAICGGRAWITTGGADPRTQETERDMLVSVLSRGHLPRGGTVESSAWHPPASVAAQEWLGRLLLGLLAGGVFAMLVMLVLGFARPRWRATPERVAGGFPVRRLLVTLLAPVVLIIAGKVVLPGVNDVELGHVIARSGATSLDFTPWSVIALGVVPILSAFAVVELAALAIPRLRWRRHDPRGRVRLGQAVAALAIVFALLQGYFMASYLEALARGGAEVVMFPGMRFRLLTMITVTAGTMTLAAIAGMIREHGLGNGYGVLLLSAAGLEFLGPLLDEPAMLPRLLTGGDALGFVTVVPIVLATACVLRWRIADGDRDVALRIPASGVFPLSEGGGVIFTLVTLSGLGLGVAFEKVMFHVADLRGLTWLVVAITLLAVPIYAWLFARPALVERVAMQAGLGRATHRLWVRATVVSAAFLVTVAALEAFAAATDARALALAHAATAVLCTAVVLDIIDDARAHRRKLAPAAVLHQIQYAGVVERVLGDAGIPCHIHASNLRTLLAFFGPWAPAIVLVPESLAADARQKLDDVLRPAAGKVPVARVRGA